MELLGIDYFKQRKQETTKCQIPCLSHSSSLCKDCIVVRGEKLTDSHGRFLKQAPHDLIKELLLSLNFLF